MLFAALMPRAYGISAIWAVDSGMAVFGMIKFLPLPIFVLAIGQLEHDKKVELLEYLVKTYSNDGETVLDNCMGSGSTGVACMNAGRKFIGIELDTGNIRYIDLSEPSNAHCYLAGGTRCGKSNALRLITTQLIMKRKCDIQLDIINEKIVDLFELGWRIMRYIFLSSFLECFLLR